MEKLSSQVPEEEAFQVAELKDVNGDLNNVIKAGQWSDDVNYSINQVNVTGMTGGHAETVTAVGILHGNIMVSRDHGLNSLKDKTQKEIQDSTKHMLVTSSVEKVLQLIHSGQRWITITGNAGEGKTTTGYLVLQRMSMKNQLVFKVDTPEDYFTSVRKKPNSIIMMNDVLGAFAFDPSSFGRWEPVFHHFLDKTAHQEAKEVAKTSEEEDRDAGLIIFVSRNNVLEAARHHLGRYEDDMFGHENTVNLTSVSAAEHAKEERLNMLDHYLQKAGIKGIEDDIKDRVTSGICPHGFPHCCKIYVDMRMTNTKEINIETFFSNPLLFLGHTTKVLVGKPDVLFLFKQMLKNKGRFTFTMENESRREGMKRAVDELKGSYVKTREEEVMFSHPSIQESVALCIGQRDPMFAVQHYDVSFILQKVKFSDGTQTTCEEHLSIEVTESVIQLLCKRFVPHILKKDYSILQHDVCKRDDMCRQLIENSVRKSGIGEQVKNIFANKAKKKIDVNCKDKNGDTMLHLAFRSNNMIAIKALLKLGADVNIEGRNYHRGGSSVFQLACVDKRVSSSLIKELIRHGADVNSPLSDGNTILHSMYHRKEQEVLGILVENGADVNLTDTNGRTVLHQMCRDGASIEDIKLLVENGASVNMPCVLHSKNTHAESDSDSDLEQMTNGIMMKRRSRGKTALQYLCSNRADKETIDFLIHHGANVKKPDNKGRTALHYACRYTHIDAVKCLIHHEAEINAVAKKGNTPLHYLYDNGNTEGIDKLLEHGADVNSTTHDGKTLLHYHCQGDELDLDFIQLLLKYGVDVNKRKSRGKKGKTALHYLVKRKDEGNKREAVEMLLNNGANVNMKDNKGKTPLHYICMTGDDETFRLLLDNKADVNIADHDGCTVLHTLYQEDQRNRLETILRRGVDVNKEDSKGKTLLHYVCKSGKTDMTLLRLLFQNGADVTKRRRYTKSFVKRADGKTALHYACNKVSVDMGIIQQLLNHGSSVNVADKHGMTPLLYMLMCEDTTFTDLQLLLDFGGNAALVNNYGQTALHLACNRRRLDPRMVQLLLECSVDPCRTDKEGKKAIDYLGKSESDKKAEAILENYGSDKYQAECPLTF